MGLRIVKTEMKEEDQIIRMCDMKPLQVGIVVDNSYTGTIVMRTTDINRFEVMDLTKPGPDCCWTDIECDHKVKLLPPGETITIELFND